ncbi:HNH endonuclease [Mycolicibacterium wolinskyi]|uniref:HNH nuclease domain-containing protein n=1 Tax=Mycolicibacterium wolinskyi TaxID=59750 RepID=A0A1X2F5C9_9MYCO|nr:MULTISPECIES: HNH endonuclease signature motif containing protein [Mycolicibacterium]MCV7289773.1 HNH endonuclease [Mycolicibacterium wolinskyi]MCV7296370.1 HNH endonuclease [Mycolicibacterium goodii]ORX13642.1 hypothetical protein AWC31_29810 [Mycolicibacterium wolinskyi]
MFEQCDPTETPESSAMIERICSSSRRENREAAGRLAAVAELFAYRLSRSTESEDWAIDTTEVVAAEIAAALRISQELAVSMIGYARAMRERLPKIGALFEAGDLDLAMFRTLVYRTDLITDADVLAAVDAELAAAVPRWLSMVSRGHLAAKVDRIVKRHDSDAVRRRREAAAQREIWIHERLDGLADIGGTVSATDGRTLDQRLAALAATVCERDPRTQDQRRSDAVGALSIGADRIACQCGQPDCAAVGAPPASPVVIHVIAEQAALEGHSDVPGSFVEADGLIPAEQLPSLAESAKLRPLIHPGDAPAEPGYTPSRALAEFVRCRDLTCRFPGCDKSAETCDIDHTIPYDDGGPTQAANLKCLCRRHHLLKTFCGWRDKQLRDGTIIWTSPSGDIYVTTPGSALLFPTLCAPTAPVTERVIPDVRPRTAMMPRRTRTRAQNRAARIEAERRDNRRDRELHYAYFAALPPPRDDVDPPPF